MLVSFAAILFRFLDIFRAWSIVEHIPYMKLVIPRRTVKLPPELSDWEKLSAEDGERVWKLLSSFLEYHGVALFGTQAYELWPSPPVRPPLDSFRPQDDEDFVHRHRGVHNKRTHFPFIRTIGYMGLDRNGRNCHLKAVPSISPELHIIRTLTSKPLRTDPRNHTVPLLKEIEVDEWVILVQPWWADNWMEKTSDLACRLKIAHELLEGLNFMHENGIAHGDIHPGNILCNHETSRSLDESPYFQTSFDYRLGFIDFEYAKLFAHDDTKHLVVPNDSRPPSAFAAPEQALDEDDNKLDVRAPYDGFKADVYNLGQVLKHELELSKKSYKEPFTVPVAYASLIERMTALRPTDRVSADQALDLLNKIYTDHFVP